MSEKRELPLQFDVWPTEAQLNKLQGQLGYYFADTQYLYDALNITGLMRGIREPEHPKNKERERKIFLGLRRVRLALADNVYAGNKTMDWDESSLTRARDLWSQDTTITRIAEELELNDLILRRRKQKPEHTLLAKAFYAIIQAVSDDITAQGGTDTQAMEKILNIIKKLMPPISAIPDLVPAKQLADGIPFDDTNMLDKLQGSKEFAQRGFYFIWSEPQQILHGSKAEHLYGLKLMQKLPGSEE